MSNDNIFEQIFLDESDLQDPPINPEILTDPIPVEEIATSENDSTINQDWFNLARKLRGQNRELLETVVKLEQALAESQQQLQEQGQRDRQSDSRVSEQTIQLNAAQAENSHLLEKLQISQKDAQRQQLKIETLQQQLTNVQGIFAQLERECALLREDNQEKTHQLFTTQEQIDELQARLQRQQRYALQYKAALDECLSKCAKAPTNLSSTSSNSALGLTPTIVPIQPWSSQEKVLTDIPVELPQSSGDDSPPTTSVEIPQTHTTTESSWEQDLEDLFSFIQEMPEVIDNKDAGDEVYSQEVNYPDLVNLEISQNHADIHNDQEMMLSMPKPLSENTSTVFSFDIDQSKKASSKTKIDLPYFIRRHEL